MPWRSACAAVLVLGLGCAALILGTDGGSIWTAEGARRQAALSNPKPLPDYPLRDSLGTRISLANPGRALQVIDLIYTRCPTVCLAMGAQLRMLQTELAAVGLLEQVGILSITFDPADDERALADYLARFHAIEPGWRAARFENDVDLARTLDELGVVVLPDPSVGFVHNAAFYLVEQGRVVAILDVEDRAGLFEAIRKRTGA
ncbi:MAG: SCO family protein [Gammaproteobacteria bacterium]|nr:SCO family protein [Gammaproteobacteria bacterium]MDE0443228.1 SCO family protein [Gammaproteobacteria bacterium]